METSMHRVIADALESRTKALDLSLLSPQACFVICIVVWPPGTIKGAAF